MHDVVLLIQNYGVAIVFAAVLIEGIGLPVPSYAVVLIAAGASTQEGRAALARRRGCLGSRGS